MLPKPKLSKEIFTERIKLLYGRAVLTAPLHRSAVQVSWRHGIEQHCNAFPPPVSFRDMRQRIHPNGRRTWWHYREHIEGILSHAFPCGHNSYQAAPIDR